MKRIISIILAAVIVCSLCVGASARLVGDVNSDGKTNSIDALLILRKGVGYNDSINEAYADVNSDGKINSLDALTVLLISVGKYDGDLEIEDELVTNYKAQIVDPVMATGCYTIITEVETDGVVNTVSIMIDGKNVCVETTAQDKTIRILNLDGKNYLVFPMKLGLSKGVYGEVDKQLDLGGGTPAKVTYKGSTYETVDGVKYVCETYSLEDGTITKYYFRDGKWAMMATVDAEGTNIQKITDFKKGVDESSFSLKGYTKIDLSGAVN